MRSETLDKYRNTLTAMRERLSGAVDYVAESIQEDVNPSGNLSGTPVHLADVASEGLDADVHILETERGMLADIVAALERIETGTFGMCQECSQPIAAARLDAIPYASLCIDCARAADGEADEADEDDEYQSSGDELQQEIDEDAAVRDDLASEDQPELEEPTRGTRRKKPRRAGQRRDELLPGESTAGSGGDRLAAGTAGGGLAAGGLGGTNRGDGSVGDNSLGGAELENAMGSGQYDDTQSDDVAEAVENGVGFEIESPDEMEPAGAARNGGDEPLTEAASGSAGGAIGGTPANKRATARTPRSALDQSDNGSDATIGINPAKPR